MQTRTLLISLLLMLLAGSPLWAQQAGTIIGGQGAGPFQLGTPFSQVSQRLGPPSSQNPSAADPRTMMKFYKEQQLAFLVNPEGKVIGITIARNDWKTAQGLGVGSPLTAFQKSMGSGLKRGPGQAAFPQHGLAVSHQNGKVTHVFVVKKDEKDPVMGDQLVVGGTRVGQMRLGNSAQDMKALLGPPSEMQGSNNHIWLYGERGIRLAFLNGRLHMIGVSTGDWVTPSGLKVGRPFAEMKKSLGSNYRVENSSVFFDQWGIGARLAGQTIVELLVFSPRKDGGQG